MTCEYLSSLVASLAVVGELCSLHRGRKKHDHRTSTDLLGRHRGSPQNRYEREAFNGTWTADTTLYDDGYCNSQRPVREFVFPTNAKLEI